MPEELRWTASGDSKWNYFDSLIESTVMMHNLFLAKAVGLSGSGHISLVAERKTTEISRVF